jgi:glycosyltransferase involved in cell wall biosynthesis
MTRIAIAVQHFPPYIGGAEQQAALLAQMLSSASCECQVLTTKFHSELPSLSESAGSRIRRLPSSRLEILTPLVNLIVGFVYFLLRGHKFDVVHTYCLSGFALGALLGARLRGCRTTVRTCTTGCGGDIDKIKSFPLGRLLWWLFRRADLFIAQTPELAQELYGHDVMSDKVVVVPNQVNISWQTPPSIHLREQARAQLSLPDKPTALFVGRLVPQKNLRLLLEAWAIITQEYDASLVIVGDGPDNQLVGCMFPDPAARRSIYMMGSQSDVAQFYMASDIFVFPGQQEAYGNVIAEAMAFGLAVISTNVGVTRSSIKDGRNGRILQLETPAELAEFISELLQDERARESMGRHARELATRCFAPEPLKQQYLGLYTRLLQRDNLPGQ